LTRRSLFDVQFPCSNSENANAAVSVQPKIKEIYMVQNKKLGAGLALVAALIGMGASGTAAALPEMDVGTLPPIVAPDSVNTVDSTVAAPEEVDAEATAS
jgi:hypothetical protein